MKAKTINAILCKKFDKFCESVTDARIRELVKANTIITGGSIVSLLLNENVNDFDIYFRNGETALEVAKYYVAKFLANPPAIFKDGNGVKVKIHVQSEPRDKIFIKSAGVAGEQSEGYQYFETIQDTEESGQAAVQFVNQATANAEDLDEQPAGKLEKESGEKYRPIFLTANAISLANKVQLVVRFYGEPEEIHRNYDFDHCVSYWTSWDRKLILSPAALESILAKELRYRGSLYPICSIIRTRKFLMRGWTINAGQYLKMAFQISKLDMADFEVLEDQLVGVDAAYFLQLIKALKDVDLKTVDNAYICTLIDKIF